MATNKSSSSAAIRDRTTGATSNVETKSTSAKVGQHVIAEANLMDAAGNPVSVTGGALDVNVANTSLDITDPVEVRVRDGAGTALTDVETKSTVAKVGQHVIAEANIMDAAGNPVGVTGGALDVNVANTSLTIQEPLEIRVRDGNGTALADVATKATSSNIGQHVIAESNLIDAAGNPVTVTSGSLDVNITGSTGVGGSYSFLENSQLFSVALTINAENSGEDNPLILFENPAASGKKIFFTRLVAGINVQNNYCIYRVFANPTVTDDGTAETAMQRYIGTTPTSGVADVYSLPTVTANGSPIVSVMYPENGASMDIIYEYIIGLDEGNSILITGDPKSNNRESEITLVWAEV